MKKLFSLKSVFLAVGVLAFASAQTSRADLVYADTVNLTPYVLNSSNYIVGDEIILAGTSRLATNFTFEFWSSGLSSSATVQIRFYLNDGTGGAPGTLLWDSGIDTLFTISPNLLTTNGATLSYDPEVVVPNQFTWTVQFDNLGGGTAGVPIYTPPNVGGNFSDYWQNDGTGWLLKTNASTDMSFGASLQATVPEPSTLALALVGAAGLLIARRRR